jgi:5-methylcytosine-specific restriction endonuclease McrA
VGYRCRACREYYRGEPYRRVSLGAVCSEECLGVARKAVSRRRPTNPDIPAATRAAVLVRDNKRCRYCGTTLQLELHHIHYRSEGVDHSAGNLITLCGLHHDLVHSNKRHWQPLCEAYVVDAQRGHLAFLIEIERLNEPLRTATVDPDPTSDPSP